MADSNQKTQKSKLNWIDYILLIIGIGLLIPEAINLLSPTLSHTDEYEYHSICGCYSMSQKDFEEIKEAINDLILGGAPDTTSLIHILLMEGPARYRGAYYQSLAAEEETCGFCDDHTKSVYLLLQSAYLWAYQGKKSLARDQLNQAKLLYYQMQAEILWKSPYWKIILGIILLIFGIKLILQRKP